MCAHHFADTLEANTCKSFDSSAGAGCCGVLCLMCLVELQMPACMGQCPKSGNMKVQCLPSCPRCRGTSQRGCLSNEDRPPPKTVRFHGNVDRRVSKPDAKTCLTCRGWDPGSLQPPFLPGVDEHGANTCCGWLRNSTPAPPKKPWNDSIPLQIPRNHGFNLAFKIGAMGVCPSAVSCVGKPFFLDFAFLSAIVMLTNEAPCTWTSNISHT